ncbi:hypothetical protein Ms3S1_29260 [Methylosinus sp. 3S-1]
MPGRREAAARQMGKVARRTSTNVEQPRKPTESANMREKHLGDAVSLATILLSTRQQFGHALRDAAMATIRARLKGARSDHLVISRNILESHIDDALYLIGRDGLDSLERNVRFAVDEMIREALENVRTRRTDGY